jgi:glutathione S-transferase
MILIGRYTSPFVRRVAISLRLLGMAYEHKAISTISDGPAVRAYNPLGRVPALVLDDGEILIDSTPILDFLDEQAGPDRALVPRGGVARRHVLKLVAFGIGTMEKALYCFVEKRLRPADKQHEVLLERFAEQALAGLQAIEDAAGDGWLCGDRLTQADITAVAALDFLRLIWPEVVPTDRFTKLVALHGRAHAMPAFAETKP